MMKKYVLFATLSLTALLLGEWRATYCGQGIFNITLPGDIRPTWFNRTLYLNDVEGWGVFYPGFVVNQEEVNSIEGYGFDEHDVYVQYFSSEGQLNTAKVVKATEYEDEQYTVTSFVSEEIPYSDIHWVYMKPNVCLWGRWAFMRGIFLLTFLGCIGCIIKKKSKGFLD